MPPRSLTLRVTAVVALAVLLSSTAGFGTAYVAAVLLLRAQLDEAIGAEASTLADEHRMFGLEGLRAAIESQALRDNPRGFAVRLRGPDGGETTAGDRLDAPPALKGALDLPGPEGGARALGVALPDGAELVVGAGLAPLRRTARAFAAALFAAGAVTGALAIAAGLVLARRAERRLGALSDAAGAVVAGDLARRLPLAGSGDELDRLTATINSMLDRIEALVAALRQVTNDVAHDLRSPLARLRQRLEGALASQRDPATDTAALEHALAELDGVLVTFAALLRIAQAEAGVRRAAFAPLDLSALVASMAEAYAAAAEDTGRRLEAEIPAGIGLRGDAALLRQAVANLLDNALVHGGPRLALRLRAGPVVEVEDDGPGIPPDERAAVVRRFYRLDRSRGTPGTGLGLALVSAVAALHDGVLELADGPGGHGLSVRLDLRGAAPHGPGPPLRQAALHPSA